MMFSKLSRNSNPKRILVVSQTNIGDVVLTCPVVDVLRRDFPKARIDLVIGPKAVSLFEGNTDIGIRMFNKRGALRERFAWFLDLVRQRYDCVVDLRRTMLPLLLWPKYTTPLVPRPFEGHKKQMHLNRLQEVYAFDVVPAKSHAIQTTKEDERFFAGILPEKFVVIAPGAADSAKRWNPKGFAAAADYLADLTKVVFVGDSKDLEIVREIQSMMKKPALSLAGQINLRQLAYVLKRASWGMVHDSGVMHLASYLNVPVLVLWGPTNIRRYAPWSAKSAVVRCHENCLRCLRPKSNVPHTCMDAIQVDDVIDAIKKFS